MSQGRTRVASVLGTISAAPLPDPVMTRRQVKAETAQVLSRAQDCLIQA